MIIEPNSAPAIVVFSDVDGIFLNQNTPAFEKAAHLLEQIIPGDVALVLCSGKTRAELEHIRRRLRIHDPFVSEFGAAAYIPCDYFTFEVPSSRDAAGYRTVEFGTAYARVAESLRLIAEQEGIAVIGLSDLSQEDVARTCHVPLRQARLMTVREYTEGFQICDDTLASYRRLFHALNAVQLRCIVGDTFNVVGGLINHRVGVSFLSGLYRRASSTTRTVGLTHFGADDDNLLPIVDQSVTVPDEADRGAIDVVDWAAAIVDVAEESRRRTCRPSTWVTE